MKINDITLKLVKIKRVQYLYCSGSGVGNRYYKLRDVKTILSKEILDGKKKSVVLDYYSLYYSLDSNGGIMCRENNNFITNISPTTIGIGCQRFNKKKLFTGLKKLIKNENE